MGKVRFFVGVMLLGLGAVAGCANQSVERPVVEIRDNEGVPALFINNNLYPPYAYMSYLGEKQYYHEVANAGLHLYNIPAYLGDRGINSSSGIKPFRSSIWVGEDELDCSSIIHDFDEILSVDPAALVIIRIHLDAPTWWEEKYPESACLLPDGTPYRTSFYSPLWRQEAGKMLAKLTNWLLRSPYSQQLIGIHVAGGFTEEWMYHFKDEFYDTNPVRLQGFRAWLKDKYSGDVLRLQAAWHSDVDFETAQLGDISGKHTTAAWRSPDTAGRIFDTFCFHGETMADNAAYFCRVVKEASDRKLLTGVFYGYHFFVSDLRRGHGALSKLLRSDDLDYLSSPNDYHRVAGEDWAPFAAIKSVQLHGKLWLAENDTRTSITTMLRDRAPHVAPAGTAYTDGVWLGPSSMDISEALLWKNLGRMLAYGYGGWWFDMWGGWFSDPKLMHVIASAQQYAVKYPDKQVAAMAPEVAVVVDEKLGFMDGSFGQLTGKITHNRYALGKMGAPYDLYLREDLDRMAVNHHRVVWLMGLLTLDSTAEDFVKRAVEQGKWVVWTGGQHTTVFSPDGIEKRLEGKIQWRADELRGLLRRAGVHIYLDHTDDVVYAGRGWICVHTVVGGTKQLHLPFEAEIKEPETGGTIGTGNSFEVEMTANETRLFRTMPLE